MEHDDQEFRSPSPVDHTSAGSVFLILHPLYSTRPCRSSVSFFFVIHPSVHVPIPDSTPFSSIPSPSASHLSSTTTPPLQLPASGVPHGAVILEHRYAPRFGTKLLRQPFGYDLRPCRPLDAVVNLERSAQVSRSHHIHLRGE